MTAAGFRRIVLGLRDAVEQVHHGHPDFRVGGRIFATLGYPDRKHGMVVLTPDRQREYVRDRPESFAPVTGKWGEAGCTLVRLDAVNEEALGEALTAAWKNAIVAGPTRSAAAARKRPRTSTSTAAARKRAAAPPRPRAR